MDYTKAKTALENIDINWKAHCDLHDIDYPEYEDMQTIKMDMKEVLDALNYKSLRQRLPMEDLLTAQIDKVCDMALDPECCLEYLKTAIQTIQNLNSQRSGLTTPQGNERE